jgi:maltose 6'-phosphate phosphatase
MATIEWLVVENTLTRKQNASQQKLVFLLAVENLHYHKQVNVLWAGEDGVWQTLSAHYLGPRGDRHEYWQASLSVTAKTARSLPGNIQFALQLRCDGREFWDNHQGVNYQSKQGSGFSLPEQLPLQNLSFKSQ